LTARTESQTTSLFLDFSRRKLLEQYWPYLRDCVQPLTNEQVWWHPNGSSNSIGNLFLHLHGNVMQWLVASFNPLEDARDRPAEFKERSLIPASVLMEHLGVTMEQVSEVLRDCARPTY
jgi:hypothetical protein